MIETELIIVFRDDFNKILRKDINETWVRIILNKSLVVFKDYVPLKKIGKQSNGEADFKSDSKEYFLDTKLILPEKFCEKLARDNIVDFHYLRGFHQFLTSTITTGNKLNKDELGFVKKGTVSYLRNFKDTIINRLERSDLIIFYPLPVPLIRTNSFADTTWSQIEHWLAQISEETKYKIYFLGYTMEDYFILRDLQKGKHEFIHVPAFKMEFYEKMNISSLKINGKEFI